MTDLLIYVADEAKIKTVSKKLNSTNAPPPPWFDEDCTNLKKEIKALGRERNQSPGKRKKSKPWEEKEIKALGRERNQSPGKRKKSKPWEEKENVCLTANIFEQNYPNQKRN